MLHFKNNYLTVFQSALYQTTTAIIQTDKAIIMTDPTWLPEEIAEIKEYINERIKDRQLYIIYTHSDFDHIIGSGAFPDAIVIASKGFQNNSEKEKVMQEIHNFDQEYYIERPYTPTYPTVDKVISKDGEQIKLGEVTLTFYKAPGHTKDSLFTVVEPFGIFLSGDYLSDVEPPFIYSSYIDYVKTVDKAEAILNDFTIHYHVPGHGNVTDQKEEMLRRLTFSQYYLKKLLTDDNEFEKECQSKFQFFDGMKETHYENIKLAKTETS